MTTGLQIRPMSLDDLRIAIDWAAAEGWNPGLEDAGAFHRCDPDGFLMGWIGDQPATAISVVRHSETFGFLGFYLCEPKFRGQGHGWATWQAGMAHLGDRTVGLDGVPDQQENYRRSGFAFVHRSQRFAGQVSGQFDARCRQATAEDLPALCALDRKVSGYTRRTYLSAWLEQTDTRSTLVYEVEGKILGVGTIRACREGHKIGPLFAPEGEAAHALLRSLVAAHAAEQIFVDVPEPNPQAVGLVRRLGLAPVFSCARMYRGRAPERALDLIFGEMTFELG